ncbi:hypothetical protein [Leptospira kanakyensis]|uniref:Uncharacterized protein n=1 Tax=Leptospira kanakyensis TaxID=2484968 RepID=A0A6N4QFJ7_9LEPT|nr:hypothetical protein [Leptospira kanakyensis]TGK45961.1 hypothetical protein EHQ11_19635 [Leptospira kanakyensis]TGK70601.1 hypothetical protein EHQ18_09125 [Leptospira kanakyensis]
MLLKKILKILKDKPESSYAIFKYILNPILGVIFTLLILLIFSPLVYKNYLLSFINYNTKIQNLKIEEKCERINSLYNKKRFKSFITFFECEYIYDRKPEISTYFCKKSVLKNLTLSIKHFNHNTNLEFPAEFEKSLITSYSIFDFLNSKGPYLNLKLNLIRELDFNNIYYTIGYDQIYLTEETSSKYQTNSIFYDFGELYNINFPKRFTTVNEARDFIEEIENLCIQ